MREWIIPDLVVYGIKVQNLERISAHVLDRMSNGGSTVAIKYTFSKNGCLRVNDLIRIRSQSHARGVGFDKNSLWPFKDLAHL